MSENGNSIEPRHRRNEKWTDAEKERGLVAVALCSDNYARASRELADQGLRITARTLRSWVSRDPAAYERVRNEKIPEVMAKLAAQHEALARRQIEVEEKLTNRLDKEAGKLPIRDVATAQRNLAVGSGIHTQRASELRGGEPVREELAYEEIVKGLRKYGLIEEGITIEETRSIRVEPGPRHTDAEPVVDAEAEEIEEGKADE